VCRTTSAVALWRSEFNGGSKQEFYVQYWRISQPLPSMLSPSIPDDRLTSDLQYTVENLEPEKHYIYSNNRKELSRGFVVKTGEMYHWTKYVCFDITYYVILKIFRYCILNPMVYWPPTYTWYFDLPYLRYIKPFLMVVWTRLLVEMRGVNLPWEGSKYNNEIFLKLRNKLYQNIHTLFSGTFHLFWQRIT
jgi:hypothetical protein